MDNYNVQNQLNTKEQDIYTRKKIKFLCIYIPIMSIAMIVLIVLGVLHKRYPTYHIDDYETVYNACQKVLKADLEEKEVDDEMLKAGVEKYAWGGGYKYSNLWRNRCDSEVDYYKFSDEDAAKAYYDKMAEETINKYGTYDVSRDSVTVVKYRYDIFEAESPEEEGMKVQILIVDDEYFINVYLYGNLEDVKEMYEDFLAMLD